MNNNSKNILVAVISVALVSVVTLTGFLFKRDNDAPEVIQLHTNHIPTFDSTDEDTFESTQATSSAEVAVTTEQSTASHYDTTNDENSVSYEPRIISASTLAGEVLSSSNVDSSRSFEAAKTIDGYPESCWCVNTSDAGGAGGKIRYDLSEYSYINGVKIINGNLYLPEDELYSLNGQIKNFTLSFSNGSEMTFTAKFNDASSYSYQIFNFDEPVATEYVILTVDSGYVGTWYGTNVCLGEFEVF